MPKYSDMEKNTYNIGKKMGSMEIALYKSMGKDAKQSYRNGKEASKKKTLKGKKK